MTSVLDVRLGAQRPTHLWVPPGRVSSAGAEYIEFGQEAGLFLDEWQAWHLDEALAERADGNPVCDEVCEIVPRQNGKDEELLVLEIGDLWLAQLPIVLHSAHLWSTAFEHFLRLRAVVERNPELAEDVAHIYTANGNCGIVLKSGCRIKFVARSKGSAVGFAGVKRIILNEAFALTYASMGASGPTTLTPSDDQTWYVSSPPHLDSEVLHDVRARGVAGGEKAGRLFFAAWENPPGTDIDDWDAVARVNPAFGRRITQESFQGVRLKIGDDEFARECLGVPDMPDGGATIFGPGKWLACFDAESEMDAATEQYALDVAPEMASACFCVAGRNKDGLAQIEIADEAAHQPGTHWVIPFAKTLDCKKLWVLPSPHPVSGLIEGLRAAGIKVEEVPAGQFTSACAALQYEVVNGTLRHLGQPPLDTAVNGAAIRPVGEGWSFVRSRSTVDISPLVASTVALWALNTQKKQYKVASF